jgi:hypothetical protein
VLVLTIVLSRLLAGFGYIAAGVLQTIVGIIAQARPQSVFDGNKSF